MNAASTPVPFWQDGLAAFTRNIIVLLRMVNEPVTNNNIVRLARSLPIRSEQLVDDRWRAKSYFHACMVKACQSRDRPQVEESSRIVDYFLRYFIERDAWMKEMLIDSVVVVLGSMDQGDRPLLGAGVEILSGSTPIDVECRKYSVDPRFAVKRGEFKACYGTATRPEDC